MKGELPEQFGRYRIIRELGGGAMGTVYLAHDTVLDGQVAIKVPRFEENEREEATARFLREAQAMFRVKHPNVCPVYDVGEHDGRHYLVMAYIDGQPLTAWTNANETQPPHLSANLVRKIALALEAAHAEGIVHRDLKPANIMIDRKLEPIVMDFGLATRQQVTDTRLTQSGAILGTPAYMPPEQVEGHRELIGPRSDIYSLGVIFYELLSGKLPFEGSVASVLGQIMTKAPPPLNQLKSSLPPKLIQICERAMQKDHQKRFSSMAEMARLLESFSATETANISTTAKVPPAPPEPPVIAPSADPPEAIFIEPVRESATASHPRTRRTKNPKATARSSARRLPKEVPSRNTERLGVGDTKSSRHKSPLVEVEKPTSEWVNALRLILVFLALGVGTVIAYHNGLFDGIREKFLKQKDNLPGGDGTGSALTTKAKTGQFSGHFAAVRDLATSPDGRYLFSASEDRSIRVWDLRTGKEIRKLTTKAPAVIVACSPDGRYLAGSDGDTFATVWSLRTYSEVVTFAPPDSQGMCFLKNNRLVFDCASLHLPGSPKTYSSVTGKFVKTYRVTNSVKSLAASEDGNLVVFGADDKPGQPSVVVVDTTTDKTTASIRRPTGRARSQPTTVTISSAMQNVFALTSDNHLRAWNLRTRTEMWNQSVSESVGKSLLLDPKGRRLFLEGSGYKVEVIHPKDGKTTKSIATPRSLIHCLAVDADRNRLLVGHADGSISQCDL